MLTLVLGGARSGKSEVAERLAAEAAGPDGMVTYVATGWAYDADMAERIAAHQARRPGSWTTVEVGTDPGSQLAAAVSDAPGVLLLDSLGTWLAGLDGFAPDPSLLPALQRRSGATFVVSDEVGLSVHPSSENGRRFRDALGLLNRQVADVSHRVLLVVAGRVLELGPGPGPAPGPGLGTQTGPGTGPGSTR